MRPLSRPDTKTKPAHLIVALALLLACADPAGAANDETVSFKCALAIDAVIAEMDRQADNQVTQEALARIDEDNGEFVCVHASDGNIYLRLQSAQMTPQDNRLIFTVDARTYSVLKTFYGR